jgi:hypothetical protein
MILDIWIAKHPEWFEHTAVDLEPGHDGWSHLIDGAFAAVEQILARHSGASFGIRQLKEKLGALTIYFREEGLPVEASDRLCEIFHAARRESHHVCEICGAPASLGICDLRLSVRCASCALTGWAPTNNDCHDF